MLFNFTRSLVIIIVLTSVSFAQNFEIKFDSLTASLWFGGDNRPGMQRNVAVAQSVFIDEVINLESFSFYFTSPFDSAMNGTGEGHEVTLLLHIRDSVGTILQTEQIILPETFMGGWVTWSEINLDLTEIGTYIFSSYLADGYDSNRVYSGIGCDFNAGYLDGEMYVKEVITELEAEIWGDWSQHTWDANFWLTGVSNSTKVEDDAQHVQNFKLEQNYPNPFNPSTTISFSIPTEEFVSLKVFNSLGEEVAELVNETKPAGNYSISFDAGSHSGAVRNLPAVRQGLTSGIYFYKLSAGDFTQTKKMIYLK